MRILLAGATGVIGHQAVPVLAAAGQQVTGLAGGSNACARHQLDWKPTYSRPSRPSARSPPTSRPC